MKTKIKKERLTLAKAIAREKTIGRKWSVAVGQSLFEKFAPESELELQRILVKWRTYGLLKQQDADCLRDPRIFITGENPTVLRKAMLEEFAELGFLAGTAIMSGNHKFFSRLAAMLQHDKRPVTHKFYADILDICQYSGTKNLPCDAKTLHTQLVKRGHRFSGDYANQIPRTLRAVCKKLGVVIATKGRRWPIRDSLR